MEQQLGNIGWLRAAVLGANDGIVSTASLVLGVASAQTTHRGILIAGVAGLVAGAMSMATGEYVSVHSQVDAEQAALAVEDKELRSTPAEELTELAAIYEARGLTHDLALHVAKVLTHRDALGAHARDELGINALTRPRPIQAALSSALSFSVGAAVPLLVVISAPLQQMQPAIVVASLSCLAALGALAAHAGGAAPGVGALRVVGWSALSMAAAAGVGWLFGTG
ncbi:MAG: VIT family protein [Pseudomonadota bacterium]|nr:VIT family protein [Pseudomonadota bacterium]